MLVSDQRNCIFCLQGWLIETWKCSSGICGLHLGSGQVLSCSVVLVRRPIKSCHLVIEVASESLCKLSLGASRQGLVEGDSSDLGIFIVS